MAATNAEIVAIAKAVADCAKKLKQAKAIVDQTLSRNTVESITWGASQDTILSDAGLSYTGAEVSNAIGSLAQYQNYWGNAVVTQGDHGGNYEKLVDPIV